MKTIVFVKNFRDGRICAHVHFYGDDYNMSEWEFVYKHVGQVMFVHRVDLVSLEGIF